MILAVVWQINRHFGSDSLGYLYFALSINEQMRQNLRSRHDTATVIGKVDIARTELKPELIEQNLANRNRNFSYRLVAVYCSP